MKVKRWLVGALAVVGVVVLAGAGWIAVHQVPSRTPPKLLWTDADLPPSPPPGENGWNRLLGARATSIQDEKLVRDLGAARESGDWDVARAITGRLATEAENRGFQRSLAELDEALARPRFADSCPATYTESCDTVRLLGHAKVAEVALMREAVSGRWEAALARLEPLLRARLDHAATSRQLISALLSAAQLEAVLEHTRWILGAASREKAILRRERLQSIAALLSGPLDASAARRAVIADYLLTVSGIRMMAPRWQSIAAGAIPPGREFIEKLVMDPDDTLSMVNAYYSSVMAVVDGAPGPMPETAYQRRFGWWIYNPSGKLLLSTGVNIGPHLKKLQERREVIQSLRDQARALATDAVAKTIPPSTCDCITGDPVWGRESQSGIFRRRSSIVACREYTTRERPGLPTQGKPPVECTQAFDGCDAQGALVRLLNRSDVWAGFDAAPAVYGADMAKRSDEHPLIVFHAGRKIRIGEPCDTVASSHAGEAGCTPIPPAIVELRTALDALDAAETGRGECAERWKALAGSAH